jgi:S-adenosylmethionine uptake transporter
MILTDNLRGAVYMIVAIAAFTVNDACVKMVAQNVPLFQMVFLRGVAATVFMSLLAYRMGAFRRTIPKRDRPLVALRVLAEVCVFVPFIIALTNMPLANVTAIMQALPLTITLAGALFLGEAVGWRRWAAIGVGFIGVLLIVRPGTDGFNGYSLLALLAVAGVTVRDLVTRRLSAQVPSLQVAALTAAGVCLLGLLGSLLEPWEPVSRRDGLLIFGASCLILVGYVFSIMVMRVGEIGFVSPFRYTALLWGIVLGWLVFGDWPAPLTLLGSAIVVATGIFTLWRERVQKLP